MAIAEVKMHNGSPALFIDGKVYPPMYATIRTINGEENVIDEEYYKKLGESGIKVFFLICDTEWIKKGAFELFRNEAEILLRAVPDAYIVARISMHAPPEWCEENPGETISYSNGKKVTAHLWTESYREDYPGGIYSFCSEKWRADAVLALKDIHERIETTWFADRVIGYFFAAGGTSEWYYLTPFFFDEKVTYGDSGGFNATLTFPEHNGVYGDFSDAFRKTFSGYLRAKYKTDKKLQEAWHDDTVTIENPKIPDCDARYVLYGVDYDLKFQSSLSNLPAPGIPTNGTNIGQFLDIDKRRDVFDFYRALHKGTADAVIYFARAVKELDPTKVTGAFYGSSTNTRYYDYGKIGFVREVLESGVVDFLATPSSYENRQPGGFAGQRQTFDTYKLHNALFTVEDDVRTHMENHFWRSMYEVYTVEDSINVMKRDFGRNICEDLQSWWFDQLLGGKRYKHPELYPIMKRMQEIARESYELDRRTCSEIALIYDEESHHVISEAFNQQLIDVFRNYDADIVGAPVDRYFHHDMANPNMPDYKLYIFLNTIILSTEERAQIKKKLVRNHATALFLYGSGIMNEDTTPIFDIQNAQEFTGFKLEVTDGVYDGKFRVFGEHPIAKGLLDDVYYGAFNRKMRPNSSGYRGRVREIENNLLPLITECDENAECVAIFADSRKNALSVKEVDGFTSIYCGSKYVNNEVIRAIAAFAGCHIYSNTNDVLYANKNYITFHASSGGEKVIRLPKRARVLEVYENVEYTSSSYEICFSIKRGQTKMFRLFYE